MMNTIVDKNLISFKELEQKIFSYVYELAREIIKMLKKHNESESNILKELMDELGISVDRTKEYLTMEQKGML